jgi:predicted nuclease of predicted toxin-antitoxin system
VRFLIDNQLPASLADLLVSHGHHAIHVLEVGLAVANDRDIWRYAAENSLVIISKDEDFSRRNVKLALVPQVVWVRLGNCRKRDLFAAFEALLPQIIRALGEGAELIELR